MKRFSLLLLILCLAGGDLAARNLRTRYRVTTAGNRTSCPVVLRDVPTWARSVRVLAEGTEIPSQLDRPLGEVAFVADIPHSRDFEVVYSSKPAENRFPNRVHAQMWLKNPDKTLRAADTVSSTKDDMYHKLHHHGPAFESEYAAYRIYFDKKQTIDTYGKKLPRLELAETMWYPTEARRLWLRQPAGFRLGRSRGAQGVGCRKAENDPHHGFCASGGPYRGERTRAYGGGDAGRGLALLRARDCDDVALHPLCGPQRRAGREPHRG